MTFRQISYTLNKYALFLVVISLFGTSLTDAREKKSAIKFGKGRYDIEKQCWTKKPTKPRLVVRSEYQSLTIRRKILRALKCRPGIKKFLDQKSSDCEPRTLYDIGLKNVCPHKFEYVTRIVRHGKSCYVVFPHKQCITYADCKKKEGCSNSGRVKSACLPDRHRIFNVWVYCVDKYRFELETLELPQCCTCREYSLCDGDGGGGGGGGDGGAGGAGGL